MEVQACLDLFLMQIRSIDDNEADEWHLKHGPRKGPSCPGTGCPRYPRLVVTGTASSNNPSVTDPSDSRPVFSVSRAQLLAHLARRGSVTDRFDHPLLFMRSGVDHFVISGPGRAGHDDGTGRDVHKVKQPPLSSEDDSEDYADLFSERGLARDRARRYRPCTALDPLLPSTATLGSLLGLARAVLSFTPKLANLSLTGFMERAVCGTRAPPGLNGLKSLSVGPPPPYYYATLNLNGAVMARLERLRICGVMLFEEEVASLERELPALKELQWTMPGKFSNKHPIS